MPHVQQKRIVHRLRSNSNKRKRRQQAVRRKRSRLEEAKAPAVIANSIFDLTLKSKSWTKISDELQAEDSPSELVLYKDLVSAYNHAAALVGVEKIIFNIKNFETAAISELLRLFKTNICPKGFEVNIDAHYNKKTKKNHFHFSIYKECEIGSYWHFFEIKNVINMLLKTNPKLHDLFIVFLRTFIGRCSVPTWFEGPMVNAHFVLEDYANQLKSMLQLEKEKETENSKKIQEALDRTGYTLEELKTRIAGIEASMKVYATGEAKQCMDKILKAKPMDPRYILRSLKRFAPQNAIVQFIKSGCELIKEHICVADFCYEDAYEHEYNLIYRRPLGFDRQVVILWDWHDHYSACESEEIENIAFQSGTYMPTICARITPEGTHGLNIEHLIKIADWPKRLSKLQAQFQKISERFTTYDKRNLI